MLVVNERAVVTRSEQCLLDWVRAWSGQFVIVGLAVSGFSIPDRDHGDTTVRADLVVIAPRAVVVIEVQEIAPEVPGGVLPLRGSDGQRLSESERAAIRVRDGGPFDQVARNVSGLNEVVRARRPDASVEGLIVVMPPGEGAVTLDVDMREPGCTVLLGSSAELRAWFHRTANRKLIWTAEQAYELLGDLGLSHVVTVEDLMAEGFPSQTGRYQPSRRLASAAHVPSKRGVADTRARGTGGSVDSGGLSERGATEPVAVSDALFDGDQSSAEDRSRTLVGSITISEHVGPQSTAFTIAADKNLPGGSHPMPSTSRAPDPPVLSADIEATPTRGREHSRPEVGVDEGPPDAQVTALPIDPQSMDRTDTLRAQVNRSAPQLSSAFTGQWSSWIESDGSVPEPPLRHGHGHRDRAGLVPRLQNWLPKPVLPIIGAKSEPPVSPRLPAATGAEPSAAVESEHWLEADPYSAAAVERATRASAGPTPIATAHPPSEVVCERVEEAAARSLSVVEHRAWVPVGVAEVPRSAKADSPPSKDVDSDRSEPKQELLLETARRFLSPEGAQSPSATETQPSPAMSSASVTEAELRHRFVTEGEPPSEIAPERWTASGSRAGPDALPRPPATADTQPWAKIDGQLEPGLVGLDQTIDRAESAPSHRGRQSTVDAPPAAMPVPEYLPDAGPHRWSVAETGHASHPRSQYLSHVGAERLSVAEPQYTERAGSEQGSEVTPQRFSATVPAPSSGAALQPLRLMRPGSAPAVERPHRAPQYARVLSGGARIAGAAGTKLLAGLPQLLVTVVVMGAVIATIWLLVSSGTDPSRTVVEPHQVSSTEPPQELLPAPPHAPEVHCFPFQQQC